jgi:hypothetical protein
LTNKTDFGIIHTSKEKEVVCFMKHYIGWGSMILAGIGAFITFILWFLGGKAWAGGVFFFCIGFQIFGILTKG